VPAAKALGTFYQRSDIRIVRFERREASRRLDRVALVSAVQLIVD
jgi:hypothetical protein